MHNVLPRNTIQILCPRLVENPGLCKLSAGFKPPWVRPLNSKCDAIWDERRPLGADCVAICEDATPLNPDPVGIFNEFAVQNAFPQSITYPKTFFQIVFQIRNAIPRRVPDPWVHILLLVAIGSNPLLQISLPPAKNVHP